MNFMGAIGNSKAIVRSLLAIAAAGALLATTGCSGSPANNASDLPATPDVKYVSAPLTGMRYVEGSAEALALASPSVACKIDNSYDARPQQGLNSTDVVFDEMVEGGLTRLVAIWHSTKSDAVGPVRSIRPMDPDIISPFGGIVCYSGGQQAFVNAMRATNVFNASETSEQGNGTFSRSKDRFAPHNVIVNAAKLAALHTDLAAPQVMWDFAPDLASATAVAGTGSAVSAVTSVKVAYPDATALWTWSANTKAMAGEVGAWVRTQDGKSHIDKATGEQVRATNVVVLDVKIDRSYLDHKYGNVPKTIMVASGDAWVFTGGKQVEAKWQKSSQTGRIILTDGAGAAITLAPGNTWVELKPAAPEGAITVVAAAGPSPSPTK